VRARTLVGRVAAVQTITALAVLAFVGVTTLVGLTTMLTRQWNHDLREAAESIARDLRVAEKQGQARQWLLAELDEHRPPEVRLEVHDTNGAILAASGDGPAFGDTLLDCEVRGDFHVCGVRAERLTVMAGRSRRPALEARSRFGLVLLAAISFAAVLVLVVARRVTAQALAPLAALADRARAIEPGTGARIGSAGGLDELERLRERFDGLIARFEEALARERRFAGEASHELRTPLTVLRAEIEAIGPRTSDHGAVDRALQAADRLRALVEALLWFSRAQGQLDDDRMEIVNLADVVRSQVAELRARYGHREVEVHAPDEALVRGDEHLLARAASNLIDNALKYGGADPAAVTLSTKDGRAELVVADHGAGIPEAVRARIFEPFFRGGRARADSEGFGLGLPLARAVARAHGGDVRIGSVEDAGAVFILDLPLVDHPSSAT
jgi:signal transduction histidine kinase